MTEVITTDRLVLRSAHQDDLNTLSDIVFSDPEVMRHAFYGKVFNQEEAAEFFNNTFDFDGTGKQLGVLILKEGGDIIGFSGLLPCSALGEQDFEIGFVLGKHYWGKGYATEIGQAQIRYGFEVLGCKRLLGVVLPENIASKAALIKTGMTYHSMAETEARGKRDVYVLSKNVAAAVKD